MLAQCRADTGRQGLQAGVQAFWDTEPEEISQQWRHVIELARPEDKTSSGIEHELQSLTGVQGVAWLHLSNPRAVE